MHKIRTLLTLTLLMLAPAVAAAKDKPVLPNTEGWLEARTANFTLYSNARERTTRKTAVELERFRESLGRITQGLKLDAQVPTTLLLFRNDKDYAPYRLDDDGNPLNVSGYFLSGPFQNYITMNATAGSQPLRVVYHEYFHAVMKATLGDLPLWLNEGLAEYYSTFRTRGFLGVVEVGHPIDEHVQYYRQVSRLHWPDVFRITPDSPSYNEGTRQGAFYAQSWLAVHYLCATDERARSLGRYLTMLRDGDDAEAALKEALGMDSVALGAAVEAYAETGSNFIYWDVGADRQEVAVTVRTAAPAEILFRLGDLLARSGPAKSAKTHLEAARKAGWPDADVDNALGVLAMRLEQKEEATDHLRAAVASDRAPVEGHILLASLIVEEAAPQPGQPAGSLEKLQGALLEARVLLEAAVARQPESVPALVGMAQTYLLEGDTAPGLKALATARRLRPLDLDILELGACLLARGGQVAESWRVVEQNLRPQDPARAAAAEECVLEGIIMKARELLEGDDREGARRVLTEALDVIPAGNLRSRLEPIHDVVAGGGHIVLSSGPAASSGAGGASQVDVYNAIVQLIQAGKHEEGLEQLNDFMKGCDPGEPLCQAAAENVASLQQLITHNKQVDVYNEAIKLVNAGQIKPALEILGKLEEEVIDPGFKRQVQDLLESLGGGV